MNGVIAVILGYLTETVASGPTRSQWLKLDAYKDVDQRI